MRTMVALLAALAVTTSLHAQPKEVDPDDLKPGLVALWRDATTEIASLQPTIALNLGDKDAPHPQLKADGGTYRWKGYLNVFRRGSYSFSAKIRGDFKLKLDGREVFTAKSDGEPKLVQGQAFDLEAGPHAIEAEFVRLPGAGKLELFWKGPNFREEPLNPDALGHLPTDDPKSLQAHSTADRGRLLFEEHSCIRCHTSDDAMSKTLVDRSGPNLTKIGERAYPGWIFAWLADPQKMRPDTTMPKLFTPDMNGLVERYALTAYLSKLGGPMPAAPPPKNVQDVVKSGLRGKTLFTTTGCAACHSPNDPKADPSKVLQSFVSATHYDLKNVGSKTRPDRLVPFLQNPLATHPSGRMPNMNLDGKDATDLANFLCSEADESIFPNLPAPPGANFREMVWKSLPVDAEADKKYATTADADKWHALGQRLMTTKGCVNCHTVEPGGKTLPRMAFPTLAEVKKETSKGCLSDKPTNAPDFGFKPFSRTAITAFVKTGLDGAGSPAPAFQTRLGMTRFNCINCHTRDGEGGLTTELMASMSKLEKAENADAITPPTLTGVGHKLRTPWAKQVLTQAGRARPWMGLRMPQYGEANVGFVAEGLALVEGADIDATIHQTPLTAQKIEAGRFLIGKNGFGCISCHDIAGIENSGTRGPDLTTTNQRVRYEWARRWLEQPLRMAPGTRMPQVFVNGQSQVMTVMNGHGDAQSDAMWAYLSLGQNLPLPAGLEPPKGLTLLVGDRPEILRTFMPEAGNKAIAVGYPVGQSIAFDAQRCRLSYAWAGNFLDATPVWANRGGAPAKILGNRYYTSPIGNPWAISGSREAPDFATRSKDPAYGADVPDGQMYQGRMFVHFDGYSLDAKGYPTFRYRIDGAEGVTLNVQEKPEPVRTAVASGIVRRFTVESTSKDFPWMLAGESSGSPRLVDPKGGKADVVIDKDARDVPITDQYVVLPQGNGSAQVLNLTKSPTGTMWRFQPRVGGGWMAVLKLPDSGGKHEIELFVWSIAKDEPSLIQALAGK